MWNTTLFAFGHYISCQKKEGVITQRNMQVTAERKKKNSKFKNSKLIKADSLQTMLEIRTLSIRITVLFVIGAQAITSLQPG